MATKPNYSPNLPYIVVPTFGNGNDSLDLEESEGFAELDAADSAAKLHATNGKQASVFHVMKVYAETKKVDVVWSR